MRQWRIIESHCKYHVRTNAPIHHIAVYIVVEIAIFIEEGIEERLLGFLSLSQKLLLAVFFTYCCCKRSTETQGIIPQRIKLYDITCTWNDWSAISCRVHPGNSLILTVSIKQSVLFELHRWQPWRKNHQRECAPAPRPGERKRRTVYLANR